jgi:hypothetical protein
MVYGKGDLMGRAGGRDGAVVVVVALFNVFKRPKAAYVGRL